MGWAHRRSQDWQAGAGSVVLLAAGSIRYAATAQCLAGLEVPDGSRVDIYNGTVNQIDNRNRIINSFLGEWLLMIDDDQVFTSDLVMKLVRHLADDRVDIVVPLICRKKVPHEWVIGFDRPDGKPGDEVQIADLTTETGLLRVDYAGSGVMLMRRRVVKRLPPPWFERHFTMGHDWLFCRKARAAGCGIFCDLDIRVGHIGQFIVWPTRKRGTWGWDRTDLWSGDGDRVRSQVIGAGHDYTGE